MLIRIAETEDALQLSQLAERTFRATFSDSNSATDMDNFCRTKYDTAIQAAEINDVNMITVVVFENETMIGFAQLRFGYVPSCVLDHNAAELQRFYLDKQSHGKGVAQHLMKYCIDLLHNRRCRTVFLGVWENNPRAIRFYEKFGFSEVGEHVFVLGNDRQRDIILERKLTD